MNDLINIESKDGQLVVSSREVAVNFEKQHKHVLEAIDKLAEGVPKNRQTYLSPINISMNRMANGTKNTCLPATASACW